MELGSLLGSIFSGGLTGLLGIVVQRFFDHKNKKLDIEQSKAKYEHELNLRQVDAEIMRAEWAQREKVAAIEAEASIDVAESKAFAASFNEPLRYSDQTHITKQQSWMLVILDFIRGIVRPGLTIYLCILTTLIYFQSERLIGENGIHLDANQSLEVVKLVISTVLYLTTTCTLWWFGVRNKQKAPQVKR